jgi:hypothetical protein
MLRSIRLALVLASVLASLALIFPAASLAQSTSKSTPGGTTRPGQTRQEPCWQQAGIPSSVVQQQREIAQNTRSQVEAVCSNSSLNAQQKNEQIHQIRAEAHQKMEGLVSAQQMETLEKCRAARGHSARHASSGNPCGSTGEPTEPEQPSDH